MADDRLEEQRQELMARRREARTDGDSQREEELKAQLRDLEQQLGIAEMPGDMPSYL